MHSSRGRAFMKAAAFLLPVLFGLLLSPGCSAGRVVGYGDVAVASTPDSAGVYLPNYTAATGRSRIRWNVPVVTYRVHGGSSITRRAAERGAEQWNAAFVQAVGGAPVVIRQAAENETESVSIHMTGWRGVMDGELSGNTELQYSDSEQTTISHADVWIDAATTYSNLSTVQNVSAHEGGHWLGLRGHSDQRADVMFPAARNLDRFTQRDVNSALTMWSGPAGSLIGGQ